MKQTLAYISRNALWFVLGALALAVFKPGIAEIKTLLLIAVMESAAIALSGIAVYAYTRIDFTRDTTSANLGFIFLGVHICVGLIVLGVYLAQYGA